MSEVSSSSRLGGEAARAACAAEAARLCGVLDEIGETERQINVLQARQAAQVAAFGVSRREFEIGMYGGWSEVAQRIAAVELADARGVGAWATGSHLVDCERLVTDLPRVFAKLQAGVIGLTAARAAASETFPLHPVSLALADEVVADEIDTVLPGQVRAMVRTRVLEIDPDAAIAAAAEARRDRWVAGHIDAATSMGTLSGHLPAEQVAACWTALDAHARAAYAAGDPEARTVSQIMADTLVERVTGQTTASDVAVTVNVVMNNSTLFGGDEAPAQLDALGPIPAPIARGLAGQDKAWLRRWFTDPADGTVSSIDTRKRRFTGGLRRLIIARDRRCRGPACQAPIRDGDHLDTHATGGTTAAANGAGDCQRCHHLDDHPDMTVAAVGGLDPWTRRTTEAETGAAAALLRWTTPIGRSIITHAPPALGYGTATKAQLRHRRRLRDHAATPTPRPPPRLDIHTRSAVERQLRSLLDYAA